MTACPTLSLLLALLSSVFQVVLVTWLGCSRYLLSRRINAEGGRASVLSPFGVCEVPQGAVV